MAHCVNRSSEEFKTLAEQSNINPIILAAKVSLWQEENGLDNFPTIADISTVKSGVTEVFSSNPELSNIGNQQQYSQYLDTIFPNSKVKDIVYHFGNVSTNNFDKNFAEVDSAINKKGFQFATSIRTLLQYGIKGINDYLEKGDFNIKKMIDDKKLQSAILNTDNPFIDKNLGGRLENTNDAYARLDYNNNGKYIVFEPEQIHILGSKQDVKAFKEFVTQPSTSVEESIDTFEQMSLFDDSSFEEIETDTNNNSAGIEQLMLALYPQNRSNDVLTNFWDSKVETNNELKQKLKEQKIVSLDNFIKQRNSGIYKSDEDFLESLGCL